MRANINLRHAEVARRYRKAKRPIGMLALRVAELQRLRRGRYPHGIPDCSAGRIMVRVICHHLAALPGDQRRRLTGWLEEHAPWLSVGEARDIIAECAHKPRRWRADRLAWRLKLNSIDRATLKITTIGAIDLDKPAREAKRHEASRKRSEAHRRAKGIKPRPQAAKPWLDAGVSRATWYRRMRQ